MATFVSLSDKLSSLSQNEGLDFSEDGDFENSAVLTDKFDDDNKGVEAIRSELRKKNSKLLSELDERYKGSKISRKQFEGDSEESEKESKESDEEIEHADSYQQGESEDVDEEEENGTDEVEIDYEDSDEEENGDIVNFKKALGNIGINNENESERSEEDYSFDDEEEEANPISEGDKKEEIDKGKATQDQLRIWDSLLEIRIALQKLLLETNKLPQTQTFEMIKKASLEQQKPDESKTENLFTKATSEIKKLMNGMFDLQDLLVEQNSETKALVTGSKADLNKEPDEEILSSESEPEVKDEEESDDESGKKKRKKRIIFDYDNCEKKEFEKLMPFRNQTIDKWNDKTQVGTSGQTKKNFSAFKTSTLKQIEQVLLDKERLIKRTQTKRSNYQILGKRKGSEDSMLDPEIFDDDDFYHQLLRELIERKTSGVTDSYQLSHHWLELQKLRSKMKRKIDTRASKGRKIRYQVIPKLVNYMAPVDKSSLSEPAFKELLNSLFGKASHFE